MPDGGRIKIVTSVTDGEGSMLADGDFARVVIEDEGKGINPKDVEKIFDPFYTTKPDGTGLGLAICTQIVDSHNGKITVESKPGKGSKFCILLPMAMHEQD
jgi:signal transduction histidine kinase